MVSVYTRPSSPNYYVLLNDRRCKGLVRRVTTGIPKSRPEREAWQFAEARQREIDDELKKLDAVGLKWLDAVHHFLSHADLKPSTLRGYASLASVVARSCLGDFYLPALTKEDIAAFVKERRNAVVVPHNKPDAQSQRRVSEPSIRRALSFMSAVFDWAIKNELKGAPTENPVLSYDRSRLKEAKRIDRHLRPVQFDRILQQVRSPERKRMLIVLVGTGLRTSELLNLKINEIDLNQDVIEFANIESDRAKAGRARRIPILPPVKAAILEQIGGIAQSPAQNSSDTLYLFPSPRSSKRRYGLSRLRQEIKKASGLKTLRIHDLRHTFASWALQQGVDLLAVSTVLGHSDVSTTGIYAKHVTDSIAGQFKRMSLPGMHTELHRASVSNPTGESSNDQ